MIFRSNQFQALPRQEEGQLLHRPPVVELEGGPRTPGLSRSPDLKSLPLRSSRYNFQTSFFFLFLLHNFTYRLSHYHFDH